MHRCLMIQEILCLILDYLVDASVKESNSTSSLDGERRKDLAVLARTCKIFHDLSIDRLWKHLPNIGFLLLTLPPDMWRVEGPGDRDPLVRYSKRLPFLHIRRDITTADWESIGKYTRRVRILSHDEFWSKKQPISMDALSKFSSFLSSKSVPSPPLCNLERILIYGSCPSLPVFEHFLSLKIKVIGLHPPVSSSSVQQYSTVARNFLRKVNQKCWLLTDIYLDGYRSTREDQTVVVALLNGLRRLRNVHLDESVSAGMIHCLSRIPLRQMRLRLASAANAPISKTVDGFRSLRKLQLEEPGDSEGLPYTTAFMQTLGSPLHLMLLEISATIGGKMAHILSLIKDSVRPEGLKSISLKLPLSQQHSEVIGIEQLRCLSHFQNLTDVHLRMGESVILDDGGLYELSEAWPRLEYLYIIGAYGVEPFITPRGIVDLAHNCSKLKVLHITLNATSLKTVLTTSMTNGIRSHTLETLGLASWSRIPSPMVFAAFLTELAPCVNKVTRSDNDSDLDSDVLSLQTKYPKNKVVRINKYLAPFRNIRDFERRHAVDLTNDDGH